MGRCGVWACEAEEIWRDFGIEGVCIDEERLEEKK